MRVAGVAIEGGLTYLASATASSDESFLIEATDGGLVRLEPNRNLDDAHRLVDLTHRVEQYLRAQNVTTVALVKTRKHSGLSYAEAFARVLSVCAVMAASVECGAEFAEIKTNTIGKLVDVDPKAIETSDPMRFGFTSTPLYWRAGSAKAYGAAAVVIDQGSA